MAASPHGPAKGHTSRRTGSPAGHLCWSATCTVGQHLGVAHRHHRYQPTVAPTRAARAGVACRAQRHKRRASKREACGGLPCRHRILPPWAAASVESAREDASRRRRNRRVPSNGTQVRADPWRRGRSGSAYWGVPASYRPLSRPGEAPSIRRRVVPCHWRATHPIRSPRFCLCVTPETMARRESGLWAAPAQGVLIMTGATRVWSSKDEWRLPICLSVPYASRPE